MLKPLCVYLLPAAGLLFFVYSFTKRFTWLCHLFLGMTCAGAPVGAWIAATGRVEFPALVLGAANALWVAGFDIIYGAQDADFDSRTGIHSIPARFGIPLGLLISSAFHALTVFFLFLFGFLAGFGPVYYLGGLVIVVLLFWEHRMVRPDHLVHVKFASYSVNQLISGVLLVFSGIDALVFRGLW